MQVAILGLSEMGRVIVDKLLTDGHEVVAWNRSKEELESIRIEKAEFIVSQKLTIIHTIEELQSALRKPRVIWSMQPAGEATETVLSQVSVLVEPGDVLIDGANSNFRDTQRHFDENEGKGIKFLGIGIAGGVNGLSNGLSLMIGGNGEAYQYLTPLFNSLVTPNGIHTYFGTGGAGHFVKMVHNGIEYGMLQAIAEGLGVLRKSSYQVNLPNAINTWQEGAIISSFLLDMANDVLQKDPALSQFDGRIDSTGLGKLTVEQAKESVTPLPSIEQAVEFRARSQYDKAVQDTFVAKLVQAIRHEWGGHEKKVQEVEQTNQQV